MQFELRSMKTRLMFALGGVVAACVVGGSIAVGVAAGVAAAETQQDEEGEPLADAGLDQTVTVDTTVQLDGSGSTDPDGSIERYGWSIRSPTGDPVAPACSDCERTRFVPTEPGRYAVTLRVTDGDGATATDTLFVYVGDAGPSVEISGDRTPEPDRVTEYTATAESSGAELVEIAWSVDDEIVAIRPLKGHADESTFRFAFTQTDTHRVQAVVRDARDRTDYDELLVQPQDRDDPSPITWRSPPITTHEPSCSDGRYMSANPDECLNITIETPEPTVEEIGKTSVDVGVEYVKFSTEGFYHDSYAGARVKDSSYVGMTTNPDGLGGEGNAAWRGGMIGQAQRTLNSGKTLLFGQEEKTETCQTTIGHNDACSKTIYELESEGRTTNVYSSDESGAYSKYGLKGGERTYGGDPTTFENGQEIEVVIITQPEKEGAVTKSINTVKSTTDSVQSTVDDFLGGDSDASGNENESTASDQSTPIIDEYHTERQSSSSSTPSSNNRTPSTGSSNSVSLVSGHSHSNTSSNSELSSPDGNSAGTGSSSTVGLLA